MDNFMDEKDPEPSSADPLNNSSPSEIIREEDEAGDEQLLDRLLKVNAAIENIEKSSSSAALAN